MDRADLAARIDHTVVGPATTISDVKRAMDGALEHGMSACVPSCYVAEAAAYAPSVPLVSTVGFPHGQHSTDAKREEASFAWQDGADRIDVVLNAGRLKTNDGESVERDLEEVVAAVPVPVTAVVETALLADAETRRACEAAREAGAAAVATATGFAGDEATAEDVALMAEYLPVKAAGVGSWAAAEAAFEAGAERIGSSNGAGIVEGFAAEGR